MKQIEFSIHKCNQNKKLSKIQNIFGMCMSTLDLFSRTNFEEAAKRMYVVNSCHCFCTFVASNLSQVLCTNGSLAQINLQMKNLKAGIQLYFLVDMDYHV